jgi:hypothetical protein
MGMIGVLDELPDPTETVNAIVQKYGKVLIEFKYRKFKNLSRFDFRTEPTRKVGT